jgi:hypothetical protein
LKLNIEMLLPKRFHPTALGDDGERVIVGRSKNTTTLMLVFMTSRLDE